jgi:membrane-associated protease RseP (regulator of RpoE activity)
VKHYGEQLTKSGPADPSPDKDGNRLLSIFGLFRLADFIADKGVAAVLSLLIGLNIFIGLFNMIPLPPFDGGHVAVATYEAVMGRLKGRRHMIDMNKMLPLAYAMVALLVLLSLSAAWLDLRHPFNLG